MLRYFGKGTSVVLVLLLSGWMFLPVGGSMVLVHPEAGERTISADAFGGCCCGETDACTCDTECDPPEARNCAEKCGNACYSGSSVAYPAFNVALFISPDGDYVHNTDDFLHLKDTFHSIFHPPK